MNYAILIESIKENRQLLNTCQISYISFSPFTFLFRSRAGCMDSKCLVSHMNGLGVGLTFSAPSTWGNVLLEVYTPNLMC